MSIRRNKNLGDAVEELMKFKTKAEKEFKKTQEDYCNLSIKAAQSTVKELQKCLDLLQDSKTNENIITVCDQIFNCLVEKEHNQLDKIKNDYDYWSDINDKFNS